MIVLSEFSFIKDNFGLHWTLISLKFSIYNFYAAALGTRKNFVKQIETNRETFEAKNGRLKAKSLHFEAKNVHF